MIGMSELRTVLKLLLEGKRLEVCLPGVVFHPADYFTDPVLRELNKLGVPLAIEQQSLMTDLIRTYHIPADKRADARQVLATIESRKKDSDNATK